MAAVLAFRSKRFLTIFIYIFIYPDASYLVTIGLLVQEKKRRVGHLGIRIGSILAIFDLQVTPILHTKFQVNWSFGSGEEAKRDFQNGRHGGHLGFRIGTILAIFDLQVNPMLPAKFRVNWPLIQEKK